MSGAPENDRDEDEGIDIGPLFHDVAALQAKLGDPGFLIAKLRDLCDLALRKLEVPGAKWHVLVVPDTGRAQRREFDTVEELADFLRTLFGQDVRVFPYYGIRAGTTQGGRFLLTHAGRFSLATPCNLDEVDDGGYLGRPVDDIPLPDSPIPLPDEEEEEDEETDGFDSDEDEDEDGD